MVGFLFGCNDRTSVVGLYADPTPGPEPEAVKYVQVSDSADCYNLRLYDEKGFLLRQTSVPAASFGQGITMGTCRIRPEAASRAVMLTPLYGGYEGTPHLMYKASPEKLPQPTTGKLRLHRSYCAGAVPQMTIYAARVDSPITYTLVIRFDVITDASEYGYIAPDEACNEQLTAEEEKEYYEQLAFQDAILYLASGRYVVYAYTVQGRIPMSCHTEAGELAEIEIRPGETTSATLDDNPVHGTVPPYGFSYRFWQSVCADYQDNSETDVIPSPDGRYTVRVQLLPISDSLYPGEGMSFSSQIELCSPSGIQEVCTLPTIAGTGE